MKFRDGLGIPWVPQQGILVYLENELVLGKRNSYQKVSGWNHPGIALQLC